MSMHAGRGMQDTWPDRRYFIIHPRGLSLVSNMRQMADLGGCVGTASEHSLKMYFYVVKVMKE